MVLWNEGYESMVNVWTCHGKIWALYGFIVLHGEKTGKQENNIFVKGFHWAKLGSFHSNVAQKEKNRHLLRLTPRCLQQPVSTPSTPKTVAMGLPSFLLLWMAGDYGWTSLDVLGRDRSWILILPPQKDRSMRKLLHWIVDFPANYICLTTKGIFNHIPLNPMKTI